MADGAAASLALFAACSSVSALCSVMVSRGRASTSTWSSVLAWCSSSSKCSFTAASWSCGSCSTALAASGDGRGPWSTTPTSWMWSTRGSCDRLLSVAAWALLAPDRCPPYLRLRPWEPRWCLLRRAVRSQRQCHPWEPSGAHGDICDDNYIISASRRPPPDGADGLVGDRHHGCPVE